MSIRKLLLLSTVAIVGVGCSEETPTAPTPVAPTPPPTPEPPPPPPPLAIPTTYNFESRFNAGESSVGITGQIARQLQLQDLKILIGGL